MLQSSRKEVIDVLVQATISCKCGCIFGSEYQTSSHDQAPKCPQCGKVMDIDSWHDLRSVMANVSDLNHEIIKRHLGTGEPFMQVPAITVRTVNGD